MIYAHTPIASYSIKADFFNEEASIVPPLGYKSKYMMSVKNIIVSKNQEGLVCEVGKIKELQKEIKTQDGVDYYEALSTKGLFINNSMLSSNIPEFISKTLMKNVTLSAENKTMDTADEINNIFKAQNMFIKMPAMGIVISYNTNAKAKIVKKPTKYRYKKQRR